VDFQPPATDEEVEHRSKDVALQQLKTAMPEYYTIATLLLPVHLYTRTGNTPYVVIFDSVTAVVLKPHISLRG